MSKNDMHEDGYEIIYLSRYVRLLYERRWKNDQENFK